MIYIIGLFLLSFIGISEVTSAQVVAKDTAITKDTTIKKKLATLVQLVIKDTIPRKETKEDSLLEKKLAGRVYSFRQFEHETFLFVKTPARWHQADWLRVGAVLATIAVIMPFDEFLSSTTQNNQSKYYAVPVIIGRIYGEWYCIGTITAVLVGYGIMSHNTEAEKIDIELFQAGVYSELVTQVLKAGIGRARPYENLGAFKYHPFTFFNTNFESMPSGHSTFAFALSTITFRHANSTLIKIIAFVPAAFTIFSRVYQNDHWASDEFFGAAIGFATGEWVVNLHEGKRHRINIPTNN